MLAGFEPKTASRDVFAGDDVVTKGERPNAGFEIHLRPKVLSPVCRAQGGLQVGRRINRLWLLRFGEVWLPLRFAAGRLSPSAGIVRPLPKRGRTAILAKPYDAFVDHIDVRFQVALLDHLVSFATGALQQDAVRIFLRLRHGWKLHAPKVDALIQKRHAVGIAPAGGPKLAHHAHLGLSIRPPGNEGISSCSGDSLYFRNDARAVPAQEDSLSLFSENVLPSMSLSDQQDGDFLWNTAASTQSFGRHLAHPFRGES